ncbi:MAG: alkaline phosphatase D family protein [Steroidobacteraceae bacterium]
MNHVVSRRSLFRMALYAAGSSLLIAPQTAVRAQTRWNAYPFQLGVASGDPSDDGFVIWTRLAPDPFDTTLLGRLAYEVMFEVAEDPQFKIIRKRGIALALPHLAHSVRVEINGLDPGREYYYRFHTGREESPAGRAVTCPAAGQMEPLRFAVTSCAHYEQGFFSAYRHLAADQPHLVFSLGDYIYEASWGWRKVRSFGNDEARSLTDYRRRYALYRLDPDLQAAHRACPWVLSWDDHEVENDYSAGLSEDASCGGTPEREAFVARRAAAYQAFFEHLPIRSSRLRPAGNLQVTGSLNWGDLARFIVLDNRQFRSPQACASPATLQSCDMDRRIGLTTGGSETINPMDPACKAELTDPLRTMLGFEQEAWLDREFQSARERWTILTQSLLFSDIRDGTPERPRVSSDAWGGYPEARRRLLASASKRQLRNLVVTSGDVHSFWVNEIRGDGNRSAGTEFVTSSVATQTNHRPGVMNPMNPHVRYHDGTHNGYVRFDLTKDQLHADIIGVDNIRDPASGCMTLASFEVTDGVPNVKRVDQASPISADGK